MDTPDLKLEDVTIKKGPETVLENLNLTLELKDYVCIYGKSGSGKTSLLRVIALLEKPCEGKLIIDGEVIYWNNQKQLAYHRQHTIGYIPQHNNLIPQLTIRENILFPLIINRDLSRQREEMFKMIVKKLEIEDLLNRYPHQLSGGQQRRAIIARALVKSPRIILADEPLTALDDRLAKKVLELFSHILPRALVIHATPDINEKALCTRKYMIQEKKLLSYS